MERHLERVQRFQAALQSPSPLPESPSSSRGATSLSPQQANERAEGQPEGAAAVHTGQEDLRKLCLGGIPDDPKHLRPAVYHALLALPPSSSLTEQYSAFTAEIASRISSLPPPEPNGPLNPPDKLLREIERDVDRTFGALAWFGAPVEQAEGADEDPLWARIRLLDEEDRKQADELAGREKEREAAEAASSSSPRQPPSRRSTLDSTTLRPHSRRQLLLRPLFTYAFLNPGVSYVQGMSYLAAILFYIFSSASPPSPSLPSASASAPSEAEASTFFALGALLSQLLDLYTPLLDGPSSPSPRLPHARMGSASAGGAGLGATVARFNALLMAMDPLVADAMDRKGVEVGGLVMRWWTTMFANEFTLPDVVRIWDRILSLYPPEHEHHPAEALSPVLAHLIDLALAIVLLERQKILSPYSRLPEILTALQSPAIEAEGVDRLLQTAWDVRERRLGRNKRSSVVSNSGASNKGVSSFFGRKLWSTPQKSTAPPSGVSDFELDDRSSAAGSDFGRPRFGSLAFSSPRSSQDLSGNVTVIDGKVLPPPPARIDQQETIASLIEQEMLADEALYLPEQPEYGVDEDDAQGPSLAQRAATGWGGLKSSWSRFAASDTAANLQKRATNLQLAAATASSDASTRFRSSDAAAALFKAQSNAAAKAQMLREQLAQEAPERVAKLKEAAGGVSGRLLASGGSERGGGPGSPRETPFTPPGGNRHASPLSSPRLGAGPRSVDMGRTGSGGPKPLLLSGAARKAENRSDDLALDSPSRSVLFARSPSQSPVLNRTPLLSPDFAVPPLSRSPSSHGRSASHFDTPSRGGASASSFRPRSSSVTRTGATGLGLQQDDDSPITSVRIRDPSAAAALRRGGPSSRQREQGSPSPAPASARPAEGGRGWQLSDAPIRAANAAPAPVEGGFDPSRISESVEPVREVSLADSAAALSLSNVGVPPRGDGEREEPFVPPSLAEETASVRPPRGSSLSASTSSTTSAAPPPRKSSLPTSDLAASSPSLSLSGSASPFASPSLSTTAETTPPSGDAADAASEEGTDGAPSSVAPSLSRSKLVRRPPAQRKRTSRSSVSSAAASVDLTGAEARRLASDFLTRSVSRSSRAGGAEGAEDGGEVGRRASHRKRASEGGAGVGVRTSRADFDEGDFFDAYGGEEE
ncbi:hypothetical protein JCM10207_002812 [Rhodosporidiobolus poonsookiae]